MAVPAHLVEEQRAVEAEIRRAFAGVTREGGVSWSEAVAIDGYEILETREAARAKDKEASWEELVEDPEWNPDRGVGGFTFLDPIGFRYYIAPAMIRWTRDGCGNPFWLNIVTNYLQSKTDLMTDAQRRAAARFARFMISLSEAERNDYEAKKWRDAYEGYWWEWGEA